MENPLERLLRNANQAPAESGQEESSGESISVGRLEDLRDKIVKDIREAKSLPESPARNLDAFTGEMLEELGSSLDAFSAAEKNLDSRSKEKLYKRMHAELAENLKNLLGEMDAALERMAEWSKKMLSGDVSDQERTFLRRYLDSPLWQRLDVATRIVSLADRWKLDTTAVKNKIAELEKVTDLDAYRKKEAELGGYE
ncbi:MAG: hypothetical protein KGI60_01395 [Patescibacteria group bacterium]|nr:hypothetical protein [Patescibacteria group bacterium]